MTEREMLEAAARAAGINLHWVEHEIFGYACYRVVDGVSAGPSAWNPRQSSDDAFCLAAALRISVEHNDPMERRPWVSASIPVLGLACFRFMEDVPDESQRADRMRLAILRCAAAQAPKEQA